MGYGCLQSRRCRIPCPPVDFYSAGLARVYQCRLKPNKEAWWWDQEYFQCRSYSRRRKRRGILDRLLLGLSLGFWFERGRWRWIVTGWVAVPSFHHFRSCWYCDILAYTWRRSIWRNVPMLVRTENRKQPREDNVKWALKGVCPESSRELHWLSQRLSELIGRNSPHVLYSARAGLLIARGIDEGYRWSEPQRGAWSTIIVIGGGLEWYDWRGIGDGRLRSDFGLTFARPYESSSVLIVVPISLLLWLLSTPLY